MGKAKIIDKDKGWKKIVEELKKASQQPFVKVGVVGSGAEATHKGSNQTVASIAAIHEYGSEDGRIPERPFIRGTLQARLTELKGFIDQQIKDVLFQKIDVPGALERLGLFATSAIKDRIVSEHIPPPLAESTIKQKTRDGKTGEVPLVDTAQMLNSIRHEVVMDGREE